MKKIYKFIFFAFLINSPISSQWLSQNSSITDNLINVKFVSDSIGWIGSGYGMGPGYKVYKTTDGGDNWLMQNDFTPEYIVSFDFRDENTGWLLSYFNGVTKIYKTINGGKDWQAKDTLTSTFLTEIKFINDSVGWCIGSGGLSPLPFVPAAFKTTDGGNSWESILVSPTYFDFFSCVDFISESEGWIGGTGYIFKTTDGGKNWIELPWIELSSGPSKIQFLNSNIGWAIYGKLFKTIDGGKNWIPQQVQSTDFYFENEQIGWSIQGSSINFTSDGGDIWTAQNSNTTNLLWDMSFINMYSGWVVGDSGTILHTQNSGTPVELMNFTAELRNNIVTLNWNTASEINNRGFLVERIKKGETTWESLTFIEGAGTTTSSNKYSYIDELIQSASYKYRLKQIDFDGSENLSSEIEIEFGEIPGGFKLYQNYPNPFNPNTKIAFATDKGGIMKLEVYDILGKKVKTLFNDIAEAGKKYEINFSGDELPSGTYFYELTGQEKREIKKMIYLK